MHTQRKPTKTISGVTPVAAVLKPMKCKHGECIYCPSLEVPQSYTPESPAIMRAMQLGYSPFEQVKARIKSFELMKHPTQKIELIIMGGTFFDYPKDYRLNFIKSCYDALNKKISNTIEESIKLNETAKHRCVALCIETRPDSCAEDNIKEALNFGATRVELGVQAIDNKIYKKVKRRHRVSHVISATRRLKEAGFKVGYHIMPGLPGSNLKKDIQMFKRLFDNENFRPDQLKIYPCQVIKGAELEKLYSKKEYIPYTEQQVKELIIKMLEVTPEYCRVMRIMREIPPSYLIAGVKRIDLRKEIEDEIRKRKLKIKEIRFREIGFNKNADTNSLQIKVKEYKASKGKEFFIEISNKDNILFGLCRLRINKNSNFAIIRELHVYGKSIELGKVGQIQHIGIGKELIKKAEEIIKKNEKAKLKIISGVGVREYYKSLGYNLEGSYMVKKI
jgi:elongator complex protein 3